MINTNIISCSVNFFKKYWGSLLLGTLISLSSYSSYSSTSISHNFDSAKSFIAAEFEYGEDATSISVPPYRPHEAPIQSVKMYKDHHLEELPYEKVLKRSADQQDGRQRIIETTKWPYCFLGQLSMFFSRGEYGGSGILVGPQHMLTAAHNVFDLDKKEWSHKIIVRLGLNDMVAPFDEIPVSRAYTFNKWIQEKDAKFDLALLVLEKPIGLKTGWCGLLCLSDKELLDHHVNITGYPGDKGFNQLWGMRHTIKKVKSEQLFYDIDTYSGQSGSGIWINKWCSPYTVGIHTLGEGKLMTGNSGVRLSAEKMKHLLSWIKETREIKQTISNNFIFNFGQTSTTTTFNFAATAAEPDAVSCYQQGKRYFYGNEWLIKNEEEGVKWLEKAAAQNHAESQCLLGIAYQSGRGVRADDFTAFKWFQRAAHNKHVKAKYCLGLYYEAGKGVPKNKVEAIKWYKESAKDGYADAQFKLSVLYEEGEDVSQDDDLSFEWCCKAVAQGHEQAMFSLALKYSRGRGVSAVDQKEASKWFLEAAKKGHKVAQHNISLRYGNGNGIEKDDAEALKWCQASAENGYANAQYELGLRYAEGKGVPKKDEEAVKWWRKSAVQKNKEAQNKLGDCYANGKGIKQDKAEALKWYRLAADQGQPDAQFALGIRYCHGTGVPQDDNQMVDWWRKAAAQDHLEALCYLGWAYNCGRGKPVGWDSYKVTDEAHKCWLRAADKGHAESQYRLATSYKDLYGRFRIDEARALWLKAAQQNHANAMYALYKTSNSYEDIPWCFKAAQMGHADAKAMLFSFYLSDQEVKGDMEKVEEWFLSTTLTVSEAYAQLERVEDMRWQRHCTRDDVKKTKWLTRAAELGSRKAALELCQRYKNGQGVPQDLQEARKWQMLAEDKNKMLHD
jgi:TPR repeat protein/V8-like Glu-specific endopeptidase